MNQRRIQFISIAAACFLFGAACAIPLPHHAVIQTSPLIFSARAQNKVSHLFAVTDASGTMYSEQTFSEAKALTQSFVPAMPSTPPSYQAALLGFGGQEQEGKTLSSFDRGALQAAADDLQLLGAVNGYGGTTPLDQVFQGISSAVSEQKGLVAVLLFSDHQPDSQAQALAAASELVNSYRDGVCIHTVHIGDSVEGAEFAKTLSDLTSCGSSRAGSALNTAVAFNDLAKDIFYDGTPVARSPIKDPCKGDLTLRGATFEFGKAVLHADGRSRLEPVAKQLNQCTDVSVTITGHTDSVGNDAYNQDLSERRANAVKDYLVDLGVDTARLTSNGEGEDNPVASNDTDEGRAQNRRVELKPSGSGSSY